MCLVIASVRVLAGARAGDMLTGNNGQDQGAGTETTLVTRNRVPILPEMGLYPRKE